MRNFRCGVGVVGLGGESLSENEVTAWIAHALVGAISQSIFVMERSRNAPSIFPISPVSQVRGGLVERGDRARSDIVNMFVPPKVKRTQRCGKWQMRMLIKG